MPKKNLLISAVLTAFILVMGTGIASAYQRVNASIEAVKVNATANAARVENVQPVVDNVSANAVVQTTLTHQDAALIAANFLGQTDLYSVENAVWEGTDAYKVVFSSGDVVYINMNGDVIGTEAPETVVVIESASPAGSTNARSATNNSSTSNSTTTYHEDGGHEHEEHDD